MPGLLTFVLSLDNQQFKTATAANLAQQQKFNTALNVTARSLAQQAGLQPPKMPPAPDPAPMEKHGQSVRHLRHELSLVSEVLGQFGTELGSLGRLAGLAFNPYLMAIAAVTIALQLLTERWKKMQEAMVETISRMQGTGNTALESHISAVLGAAAANTEFGLSLEHSADGIDRETQAMENRIQLFHATVDAQNAVFASQSRATDAQIDADEAMRRITPIEAERRHQAQHTAVLQSGFTAANDAAQNEIDEKIRRQAEARRGLEAAKVAHVNAVADAAPGREAIDRQQKELETREKQRDEMQKAAADAQSGQLNPLTVLSGKFASAIGGFSAEEQADFFKAQAKKAEDDVAAALGRLKKLQNKQAPLDANIAQAKKKADIEQSVLNTYTQQIRQQISLLAIKKQEQKDTLKALKEQQAAELEKQKASVLGQVQSSFGVTNFEKMGFHFNGGGPTLLVDHARTTAEATRSTAQICAEILATLRGRGTVETDHTNQHP